MSVRVPAASPPIGTLTEDQPVSGETELVQEFLAPLASAMPGAFGLADDCALLSPAPGTELVLKTDPVVAGVHFLADDAPADIAWKALAVNVSDLVAKGARPTAYLLALAFPQAPTRGWMRAFAAGLAEAQAAFGCGLIGGDTDRVPAAPLSIAVTVIGTVPAGSMIRRGTARDGDRLFVTGPIGDAALGLRLRREPALAARWGLTEADVAYLVGRYLRPRPRPELIEPLRRHARAAMDLSDGLVMDLGRLGRLAGCGASLRAEDIPLSDAAARAVASEPALLADLVTGGDDYHVLAAVPPDRAAPFAAAAPELFAIGELSATWSGVDVLAADGTALSLARTGWDHL